MASGVTSEQQFGHFDASLLMEVWQYGHVRVVFGCLERIFPTILTTRNTANIVIKKLIIEFINIPMFIVVAPASWAAWAVA